MANVAEKIVVAETLPRRDEALRVAQIGANTTEKRKIRQNLARLESMRAYLEKELRGFVRVAIRHQTPPGVLENVIQSARAAKLRAQITQMQSDALIQNFGKRDEILKQDHALTALALSLLRKVDPQSIPLCSPSFLRELARVEIAAHWNTESDNLSQYLDGQKLLAPKSNLARLSATPVILAGQLALLRDNHHEGKYMISATARSVGSYAYDYEEGLLTPDALWE